MPTDAPPAAGWTLDVLDGDGWRTVHEKPSGDACKTAAREWRRWRDDALVFQIYDPEGRLAFVAMKPRSGAARLTWQWGSLKSREEIRAR